MSRVVTTTRYVTTLRFMAYLTGTQVTSSEVDIARKRASSQMHVRGTRRYGICILDGGYLTWAVSSSRKGGHSNLRVRWNVEDVMGSENRVVHLEIYGQLVLLYSKEIVRGLGRRRMQSDFSRTRRVQKTKYLTEKFKTLKIEILINLQIWYFLYEEYWLM